MELPSRFTYPSEGFSQYWRNGMGRNMLSELEDVPSLEEIEKEAKFLFQYDSLADQVIEEVYGNLKFRKANELINQIIQEGIQGQKNIPDCLREFFIEIETIPQWLDGKLLEKGTAFCRRSGPLGLIVLRNFCLMGGYESSAINKPLIATGALKKGAAKRMAETVEFWVDATGKNSLIEKKKGYSSAVKVRLMHAYARVMILKSQKWENHKWGVPLNQWDMLATNLGFSIVFIEGLKKLGFHISDEEQKGVFHLWKYIGYLLGIPANLLPNNRKESILALYKWTMSQPPADEDTKALAHALMNEPLLASYPKGKWHKEFQVKFHLGYNYFFMGKRACQVMELPKSSLYFLPYIVKTFNQGKERLNHLNDFFFQQSIYRGRQKQELIKKLFLKGHTSALASHKD